MNVLSNRAKRSVSISALRRSSASHNKATISTAIWRAADIIIEKGKRIAAEALEAAEADIRFEEGRFIVAGTDRAIDLLRVAAIAREAEDPLDTYYAWTREWMAFPNGAHVVEVEIDRDTGEVNLARYTAVDDYGVVVNPMVAAGQAHGAIDQGAGQALLERAHYDPGSGQVLAGSFMYYPLLRADDLVSFELRFNPTRCMTNPLGVKGCGEAGMVGAFPAITNAVLDALTRLGMNEIDGPATAYRVWRLISSADRRSGAKVNLTLRIEADAEDGFSEADIGVVRDNARQLKFKAESAGFE